MSQFHKLNEQTVFQGQVMRVVTGEFESPSGERFEREKVAHSGAVVIVPVLEGGQEVVCVRQYRSAVDDYVLEVPAGRLDVEGEPPERAAERELAEEAGYLAGRMTFLCRFYPAPGYSDETLLVYLAEDLTPCRTDRHGPEEQFMTVETLRLDEVAELVAGGRLIDGKTILSLFLAREALAAAR